MITDEQIKQLQECIKSLEQQMRDLKEEKENLSARLSDAEDAIEELEDRVEELEEAEDEDLDLEDQQQRQEEYFKAIKTRTPWMTEQDPEKMAQMVCDVRVHKRIAGWQFSDMPYMGFNLPETLEEIEFCVFNNCPNLRSIVIPSSVKIIERKFCNNCPSLKTVTFLGPCPEKLGTAFVGCTSLEEIIVPEGEVEKYKATMPGLADKIHC